MHRHFSTADPCLATNVLSDVWHHRYRYIFLLCWCLLYRRERTCDGGPDEKRYHAQRLLHTGMWDSGIRVLEDILSSCLLWSVWIWSPCRWHSWDVNHILQCLWMQWSACSWSGHIFQRWHCVLSWPRHSCCLCRAHTTMYAYNCLSGWDLSRRAIRYVSQNIAWFVPLRWNFPLRPLSVG